MPSLDSHTELTIEVEKIRIALAKEARACIEELDLDGTNENDHEHPPDDWTGYQDGDDVERMMDLGASLADTPWGVNCWTNRSYYIAGTGHEVKVKPKYVDESPSQDKIRKIQRFISEWMNENGWMLRQQEVCRRNDTYGETYDALIFDRDGMVRLQFGESIDVFEDPDSDYNGIINNKDDRGSLVKPFKDEFGVRRTNDIRYRKIGYYLGDKWYRDVEVVSTDRGVNLDPQVDTEEDYDKDTAILQRTRGLGVNANRGRTIYFPVRSELVYAKRIIANVMRVSSFQAAFGALRSLVGGQAADQMKAWARDQDNASSNGMNDQMDIPAPGVVTTTSNIKWEFPETGRGLINHMEILVGILRVCASGLQLPEFMLTANVSEGNFASTLVSEGPFHKAMDFCQQQVITEDMRIYWAALRWAAQSKKFGFTLTDLRKIRLEVDPPRVQTRNRKEDFDIASELHDKGLLSGKTLLSSEQYDSDSEYAQRALEIGKEQPLPIGSSLNGKAGGEPGPMPKSDADPMKEPGVSKGNPEKRVPV